MGARQFRGLVAVTGALMVPAVLSAQSELRGRLVDAAGEPIRGAVITVVAVGYQVRSDSTGRFAISGQRGSTLKLQFSAPDYRNDSASVVLGRVPEVREFKLDASDAPRPAPNPSDKILTGRVVDVSGAPLSYANVQLNFSDRFMADDSGRFQLPMPAGSATLIVRRIGFEPGELRLLAMPDTSIRIVLQPIPVQLKGVTVTGASPFRSLDIHNFYSRMKEYERGAGRGYFITPEDIEKRRPAWITQMAEGLPSIRVCAAASITCRSGPPLSEVILGRNGCKMTVYVDNIRVIGGRNDEPLNMVISAGMVAAMEVYPTALNAPPQFQSTNGTCGVVLIWTK
jgi:hypothetical protein